MWQLDDIKEDNTWLFKLKYNKSILQVSKDKTLVFTSFIVLMQVFLWKEVELRVEGVYQATYAHVN